MNIKNNKFVIFSKILAIISTIMKIIITRITIEDYKEILLPYLLLLLTVDIINLIYIHNKQNEYKHYKTFFWMIIGFSSTLLGRMIRIYLNFTFI